MRIAKDGKFDSLFGASLSTSVSQDLLASSSTGSVSSGSYNITFGITPWGPPSCSTFLHQANYVIVGGTQQISVSGRVVADSGTPISHAGNITFSIPFPVPEGTSQIGGVSAIMNEDGTVNIPSNVFYDPITNGIMLKYIQVGPAAYSTIWFTVLITLPVLV